MELFDKKYVNFMWSDELEGKEVFVGDNIDALKSNVENNQLRYVCKDRSYKNNYPFMDEANSMWRFCYYDPNYKCKVALNEGKVVQVKDCTEQWVDVKNPEWNDGILYRVKPEPQKQKEPDYKFHIGDVVRISEMKGMITGINTDTGECFVIDKWYNPVDLEFLNAM